MRTTCYAAVAASVICAVSFAQTQPSAAVPTRPAYTLVRWNEDYSYLKNPKRAKTSGIR